MPATTVISKWMECGQGFIHNSPPRQENWNAYLFLNTVEVRENAAGQKRLFRKRDVKELPASSKPEMQDEIAGFVMGGVRMLREGIEANDEHLLPLEEKNPPAEVIDGTAKIYAPPIPLEQTP